MLSKLLTRAVGAEVEMKEVRACGSFGEGYPFQLDILEKKGKSWEPE